MLNATQTYTENQIEKWNTIEGEEPINSDKDVEDIKESDENDQEEEQGENPLKATEAIQSFDKAIAWAEANTSDYAGILALTSLREKAVQKSLSERKKQTSVREFFK